MPRKKKLTPGEKIDAANAYIRDGALHTGAKLLREAADEIEAIAVEFDKKIDAAIAKADQKATP